MDIGLTIADHDVPRLGVLTHRHMALARAFNYHFRGMLRRKLRWSTISIDCRNGDIQSARWTKRGISAIMNMGNYTHWQRYSPDGTFRTTSGDTVIAYAIDRPCNSKKHQGQRWATELHQRYYTRSVQAEDLILLRCFGFDPDGKDLLYWGAVPRTWAQGSCPVALVLTFYGFLFVEVCRNETSELSKLEHLTPHCLGTRITIRHGTTKPRTIDLIRFVVSSCGFGRSVVFRMSLNCIGGTQIQRTYAHKGSDTMLKIEEHRIEYRIQFDLVSPLADIVVRLGGHLGLELPRGCDYWYEEPLQEHVNRRACPRTWLHKRPYRTIWGRNGKVTAETVVERINFTNARRQWHAHVGPAPAGSPITRQSSLHTLASPALLRSAGGLRPH